MKEKKGFSKEEFQNRMRQVKDIVLKNKNRMISTFAILLVIIGVIEVAIFQADNQREGINNPELAKVMTYAQVKDGEEAVDGTDNVKFDAFFLRDINNDGYAEGIRGTSRQIGKEDTLYMELNVLTEGYLKNAQITIDGKNFYLQTVLPKDQQLKENYIGRNIKKLEFNDMNNGTQKMITGIVRSGDYSYNTTKASAIGNNVNNYSNVNSVTLTGIYVGADGKEIEINKTVEFNIDWYGITKTEISGEAQKQSIEEVINEKERTVDFKFEIYSKETANELILSKNYVEAIIPELNGYAPSEVIYTGNSAIFDYNSATRTVTLKREAFVYSSGVIRSGLTRENKYEIKVVYPIEAYQTVGTDTIQLSIPVMSYYEGYNNQSTEFINPYKSNLARTTIVVNYERATTGDKRTKFEVKVGKNIFDPVNRYMVSKEKPINLYTGKSEQEKDDIYTVLWKAYIGTDKTLNGIVMKETENGKAQVTDQFIKTNAEEESVGEIVKNVGIYFTGASEILGEEGWIKVYDEDTGNLIATFTELEFNKYTASNPYKYDIPVKHIRVETSNVVVSDSTLYVYNIKEIDDEKITSKYTEEQFDELQYIKSTLTGYLAGEYINTDIHQVIYEKPVSIANIKISNNTISTQITEKNEKIIIETRTSELNNQVKWQNGIFLVKLPKEIIDVQLNEVTIDNYDVILESYEIIEKNEERFIKIITKNDSPQEYNIILDVDITADPRIATTTKPIELYATNENESDYYYKVQDIYDVNNDLNMEERVNYTTANISMISPNSLLTNQTASNYDDNKSVVVSPQIADIRPIYAVVDQEKEEQTATIGVQLKNNYVSTISEVKLLGKIPFEGNTYVISGANLGSTFTTKMTSAGIQLPEELEGIAKVYYTENENPDRDVSNEKNGWKTKEDVENWGNVKAFLIDLEGYTIPTGKEYIFNYEVKIPNGLKFNQVSYSHHGVWFSLDTENGKYRTQTEPNKLGFRIAEKYDLELEKYHLGKDKKVSGATYSVKEIKEDGTEGETKTGVTSLEGNLRIANLYSEKIYEIKEIKTPNEYELNEDTIRFIGHVDNKGTLTIEKISGVTRENIQVNKEEKKNYKVIVKVEDEVKASMKITKKEKGAETTIPYVKYKLIGYGLPETGKIVTTNRDGEVCIKGLSINKEYTLQETRAEGYYLADPIKFRILNTEGSYVVEISEGTVASKEIVEDNGIPALNVLLEDERIPTYDLEITKIKKVLDTETSEKESQEGSVLDEEVTYLQGAKFKLYKGTTEIGEYTTDSNGKLLITGLYQFEEEKGLEQTYTLKEVLTPVGYSKVKDIVFKVGKVGEELQLKTEDDKERKYEVEGNTVKLIVEDSPVFRLIKKDKETQEPIANVKFAIYSTETGEPATNSKGEILGNKEVINGQEYYTISTNENGEIAADLTEGLYKAIEVQAPEQYDITNSIYYFGIGTAKEGKKELMPQWAKVIGGSGYEAGKVVKTKDDGYIVNISVANSSDKVYLGDGSVVDNNNNDNLYRKMLVKYSNSFEKEWMYQFTSTGGVGIDSLINTNDGGCILGGYFRSDVDFGDGQIIKSSGMLDGYIIKYDSNGNMEWKKILRVTGTGIVISSIFQTKDEGYIIRGTI